MNIVGIGTVNRCGRGLEHLREALAGGESDRDAERLSSDVREGLKSAGLSKSARRADRFSRMTLLAAHDAVVDSQIPRDEMAASVGIILATGLGPHVSTFGFLDGILDFGEKAASPTVFSHSVHNAATSYVASMLGSNGASITVTRFALSWHHALLHASAWLDAGRSTYVLVGATEESGAVMEAVLRARAGAEGSAANPATSAADGLGEGSVFFLLTRGDAPRTYAALDPVFRGEARPGASDLTITSPDLLGSDSPPLPADALPEAEALGHTALFGRMMTGCAFSCLVGALVIRDQTVYAALRSGRPGSNRTRPAAVDRVWCIQHDRTAAPSVVCLRAP